MGDYEEPISDYGSDTSKYDFEELESLRIQKGKEVNDKLSHYKELDKSMRFKDLEEAKKVMNFYAIANSKSLKLRKSDKIRVRYRCVVDCPFVCLISEDKKGLGFKIKTLKTRHNCEDAFENPRAKTKTLAKYFRSKVQNNLKYKIKDMKLDLKNQFLLNVHNSTLKRAKRMALQQLQGIFLDDYNILKAYTNEIRERNHGSNMVINLSKDAMAKGKRRFLRMYICFNAMKLGFKEGLRPVIGLDRTFLKGYCNGQLLVVVAQDWSIGSSKNCPPLSNHRFCVRHIEANRNQLKSLGELSVDASKELLRYPPQNWCMSYFDTLCKYQMMDNNFTKSFNSWILEARGKLILKMLEDIRIKVMNRLREKEEEARTWGDEFSPNCMKLYAAYLKVANLCTVHFNGKTGYEVSEGDDRHRVNLVEKKCTCRSWQLTGIPCPHAIRALKYKIEDPMTEISWWHNKEAYLVTYRAKLMLVKGEKFWKVLPEHAMDPPPLAKTVGRPKVKRNRENDEANKRQRDWTASRRGTRMACSICGELDHNSRTCKVGVEGNIEDVSCSAPQPTQPTQEGEHESEFVFMPTPRVPRHKTEPFGDGSEHESGPALMPKIISEDQTRLLMRQQQLTSEETRVISFGGDHTGVSYPTDLPYSPTKLTWKGKEVVT
ncbi:uncharacterized protein LOC142162946 [Nicotiana tabacum]|uniref:Uncharacterized protein LOC142162946 n=1 Tax=Nicotiana tabacum TaxID=4097 RepID=A0AC58RU78_TOBAC